MNTSIYIMTHKKCPVPPDPIYKPLQVGRALNPDLNYISDNTGDNISELNPLFGELTGIYWVWRNDTDSDNVGICHYRRYFMNSDKTLLNTDDITRLLSEHDIITSPRPIGDNTNYDRYASSHNIKDYDIIGRCVHELYPDYDSSFEWFKSEYSGCFGNLAIMPQTIYSDYCNWMFSILFEASEHIDVSGYDLYHRRVYGFLSEILMNVWIHHNSVDAYECPIMFTSEKAETIELKSAISNLIRENRIKEARSLYYDITRIRPDVLLPESDISGELLIIEQILYIMDAEESTGIPGLINVSHDLPVIIEYYKKYADIITRLNTGDSSEEEKKLLEESCITPIASDIILQLYKK